MFEKFYQVGSVALHSSGKTIFKGSIPAGSADVSVSVDIASVRPELSANTIYGYSVVATNAANATAYGPETNSFTTLAAAPSIEGESVSHLTPTDATLEAQINNIVGAVTNGLFARRGADVILVGTDQGVRTLDAHKF